MEEVVLPILKNRGNIKWILKEEIRTAEVFIRIEISSNELFALLSIKSISDIPPSVPELKEKFKSTKLVISSPKEFDHVINNILTLKEVNDFMLAMGVAPKHGKDAKIKLNFNTEGMNLPTEEIANVDYKEIHKIVSIKKGEVLAYYIKETEGVPGTDVYGKQVAARKGRAEKFIPSKNTIFDEKQNAIKSEIEGIPSFANGIFKVEPAMEIPGNVDLTVGNQTFSGTISVHGDVLDGFKLHSDGDMFIRGMVGACELSSNGKITIHGGVAAKGKGMIKCRELQAKFLNEVNVEVDEKLIVHKEIIGSFVCSNGSLSANVIIGGRVIVRDSLDVNVIGSEQNVETNIEIGSDYKVIKNYEKILEATPKLDEHLKKCQQIFAPFISTPAKLGELSPEQQSDIKRLFDDFKIKLKERNDFESILQDSLLSFKVEKKRKKNMLVHKMIYENVRINSRFSNLRIPNALKGPMVLKEDFANKTFFWTLPP